MTDANTVMVQAVRSFMGEEGDKGPASEPFPVSRQRYADLKANGLVEKVAADEVEVDGSEEPDADDANGAEGSFDTDGVKLKRAKRK